MKQIKLVVLLSILLFAFFLKGCQYIPNSKKDYLNKFEAFVNDIETQYKTLPDDAWKRYDRIFKDFTEKWYKHYELELDLDEKMMIKKNKLRYQIYRNHLSLKDGLKKGLESLIEVGEDLLEVIETQGDSLLNNIEIEID